MFPTTPDSNPPAPDTKLVSDFPVPSLKILAARAIKDRNLFFSLYNKGMDPEIEKKYVQFEINKLIADREHRYAEKIAERQEQIEDLSQDLSGAEWFRKLLCWGFGLSLSALHVGIYFILRANDDISDKTKLEFIATIPVSLLVGLCVGTCCLPGPLARVIAYCKTPGVPSKEVIDLDEEAHKGSLTV